MSHIASNGWLDKPVESPPLNAGLLGFWSICATVAQFLIELLFYCSFTER